jgi:hypothetical protein
LPEASAQDYILLLKKKNHPKNYKYRLADEVKVSSVLEGRKISGQIHQMTDSSIVVNFNTEILLEDISMVYRERYFFKLFSPILVIAGTGYFILDGFNRTINRHYPIITENTMMVSASIIAVGFIFKPLDTKRYRIGRNWELQMLDMSF